MLCIVVAFANRICDFTRFAETKAHAAFLVANNNECAEPEAAPTPELAATFRRRIAGIPWRRTLVDRAGFSAFFGCAQAVAGRAVLEPRAADT